MIKLMKYLKRSAGYVILIVVLLFLQAYCDLSLPDYTSRIVNVGIQQKGIEDGVPEKIRVSTMDSLRLFMDEEAVADTEAAYMEDGDLYVLDPHVDKETRAERRRKECFPLWGFRKEQIPFRQSCRCRKKPEIR